MMRAHLLALCLTTTPLHAGELPEMAGGSIDLGDFHGIVYFTEEPDGYRVVTTIAQDAGAGLPLRFVATLAEDQSISLSVPGALGEPRQALDIARSGDGLVLTGPAHTAGGF
jgi:hypothetical protein